MSELVFRASTQDPITDTVLQTGADWLFGRLEFRWQKSSPVEQTARLSSSGPIIVQKNQQNSQQTNAANGSRNNKLSRMNAMYTLEHSSVQDCLPIFYNSNLLTFPTTCECVHLVTRGHFRPRDKDGGHIRKPHAGLTEMQTSWLCVLQNESCCRSKFYFAGIRIFDLYCCCDFDLDPMTFIYELDPYSPQIYRMCENALRTSRLSQVIVIQPANACIQLRVVTSGHVTTMIGEKWARARPRRDDWETTSQQRLRKLMPLLH